MLGSTCKAVWRRRRAISTTHGLWRQVMGKFRVRYLVAKRQKSRILYYWQPNKPLRDAGFLPRRLAERTNDLADAIREAEGLNRELDAWRAGRQPLPVQPGT